MPWRNKQPVPGGRNGLIVSGAATRLAGSAPSTKNVSLGVPRPSATSGNGLCAGAVGQSPVDVLKASLPAMQEQYVQDSEVRAALIAGYEDAVDSLLDDHVISEEEQSSLADYADALGLSRADLDRKGAYTNVALGTVLREVTAGRLPQQQPMQGDLPFNFQKSEELVWTFQGVTLYEGRSRTR